MLCPACENESENTQQCQNCGWQFVYFTQQPTEEEQNEYTSLLQNYRTELYFNLAQQYYQNKQFEETIQCCLISCEHQLFENPLALLALSHKELGNNEEALKYANMAIEINSNNEMARELLTELSTEPEKTKKIITLTPEILEKDMFETTEEYQDRIKNLGYVEIGIVNLINYDADKRELKFNLDIERISGYEFDTSIDLIYNEHTYTIIINPSDAQNLYLSKNPIVTAKIDMRESNISILDIKVDKYSFYNELEKQNEENEQRKNSIKEKNEILMQSFKNLPEIWFDEITNLEWQTEISSFEKVGDYHRPSEHLVEQLKSNLKNIDNKITQTFLNKIELEYKAGTTYLLYRKKPDGLLKSVGKGLSAYLKSKI